MSMIPWNGDINQALKWLQSNAPAIQSLIKNKADWHAKYQTNFWQEWQESVFDLRTAGPFGLVVWCIILGVPSQLFGFAGAGRAWAYGPDRQNYVYSGADATLPVDKRSPGGNFYGGGNTTLLNLNEVRWVLMLRYAALVSNGRIEYMNRMLNYIFNGGEPWDMATHKYFYVRDVTSKAPPVPVFSNVKVYVDDWQGKQLQYTTPRQNLAPYSEDFSNSLWNKTRASIQMGVGDCPNGTGTGMRLVETVTSTANTHYFGQTRGWAVTAGEVYTFTVFAKADQRKGIVFNVPDANFGVGSEAAFDLVNGLAYTGGRGTAKITPMKQPGWFRCDYTIDVVTSGFGNWTVNICQNIPTSTNSSFFTYIGDGTSGVFVWGGQFGLTPVPYSYIKNPGVDPGNPVTDYSLSGADVTFAVAPLVDAKVLWSGNSGSETVVDKQIGIGDGVNKNFNLSAGSNMPVGVPAPFRLEYQIGRNMGFSSQFVNLLNDERYGIMPSAAGSKVVVNQES